MKQKKSIRTFGLKWAVALSALVSMLLFSGCSPEQNADHINGLEDIEVSDLKMSNHDETWQDQIDRLTKKMRRFHNFQVAQAQGWDVDASGYVPYMGHHYINQDLADATFELLKPEALLYVPDGEGGWEFVAVEYLIFGIGPDEPAPDGFIGPEDKWFYNHEISAWTLHAWIALENPDGVFYATNSKVPQSP